MTLGARVKRTKMKALVTIGMSICLFVLLCQVSLFAQESGAFLKIHGSGQQKIPNSLLTRVSVNLAGVNFENALAVISEKGDFKLSYSRTRIPVSKKVTIEMENVYALEALLDVLEETGTELLVSPEGELLIVPLKDGGKGQVAITGQVVDAETKEPLWGTNISIAGTGLGAASGPLGKFIIESVPIGIRTVQFSHIGYELQRVESIVISSEESPHLAVELRPETISLSQVIVTPSQFSIMGKGPTVKQTLTREDLEIVPFGEDIYRATKRLPGIAASDFSAKFTVRGGENEEILVLLDGMELYEPFHLKDFEGGAISIIDAAAIDGIDLMTGGFSAEFGDRLSGVFNIKSTRATPNESRTSLGLSFMNARIMSAGTFAENKGAWLVSARRGYLDLVLDLMGEEDPPRPVYYDFLSKVEYQLDAKHTLSVNFLRAGDRLDYVEDDDDEDKTGYGNTYGWLTSSYIPSSKLFVQSLASFGRISRHREGTGFEGRTGVFNFVVADDKNVDLFGFKQDWNLDISKRWFLRWGYDLKYFRANYDYQSILRDITWLSPQDYRVASDTSRIDISPTGNKLGAYLSNRFQLYAPLTVEVGLRFDHNSFSGDDLFSPRLNAVYALGKQTSLRAGWGRFYQSQGVHEVRVHNGEDGFFATQLAKHYVAGLEHTFRNGLNLRLEGYYKDYSDLPVAYRNLTNEIEIFPEVQDDRFRLNLSGAKSKGIEAYVKYDRGGKVTWWASYALAKVNEDVRSAIHDGTEYRADTEFPGRFDQRHSLYLDLNYRPNRRWHLNTSWQYHTGWPFTETVLRSEQLPDGSTQYYSTFGVYHGTRYPAYHRMDLTINRHFYTSRGRISTFLALTNVYNHTNIRNIDYRWVWDAERNRPFLDELNEHWFRFLPSIGVSWSWEH